MNKESSFNKSKDTITLKIEIPKEIYPTIKQRANDQHVSVNSSSDLSGKNASAKL